MISLFIDVVSNNLMVALIGDKELVDSLKIETNDSKYASDLIVPKIEKLLLDNNLEYTQLDNVFTVVGPGNYTNIRTGIAITKGISISRNIPAFGITQHELIARTYNINNFYNSYLMILVPSNNGDFYCQNFSISGSKEKNPDILNVNEVFNQIQQDNPNVIDTSNELLRHAIKRNINLEKLESNYIIDEKNLSELQSITNTQQQLVQPIYVRDPNVKKYKKKKIYE